MGEMADWVIENGIMADLDDEGCPYDEAEIRRFEDEEEAKEQRRLRRNTLARKRYKREKP